MRFAKSFRSLTCVLAAAAVTALSTPAFAQMGDSASAEALFREGRALMDSGDVTGACAKFRESNRLDPAVGTLFNIADCEEKLGHLAQAWTLFQEVTQKLPASDERHGIAESRAKALEPRLPRLRVTLAVGTPEGSRVTRDGVELGAASLGSALPVDPGAHRIVVYAEGREPRTFSVTLRDGEERALEVAVGAASPHSTTMPQVVDPGDPGQKTLGYVVAGIGVAGLVTGAIAGVMVLGDKSTVEANCDENKHCNQEGLDAAEHGKTFGVITTVGLVTGAVGLGAGTYLILSAAPPTSRDVGAATVSLTGKF